MSQAVQDKKDSKQSGPVLCNKCHQFYGNSDTDFLCSKCYKEVNKDKPQEKEKMKEEAPVEAKTETKEQEETKEEPKPTQADKSKCWACKRKVGIMGIACKCGFTFCSKHRIPEEHECQFDFKQASFAKDMEKNPQIAPQKMEKIQ